MSNEECYQSATDSELELFLSDEDEFKKSFNDINNENNINNSFVKDLKFQKKKFEIKDTI